MSNRAVARSTYIPYSQRLKKNQQKDCSWATYDQVVLGKYVNEHSGRFKLFRHFRHETMGLGWCASFGYTEEFLEGNKNPEWIFFFDEPALLVQELKASEFEKE
jgi:hypothetical protein